MAAVAPKRAAVAMTTFNIVFSSKSKSKPLMPRSCRGSHWVKLSPRLDIANVSRAYAPFDRQTRCQEQPVAGIGGSLNCRQFS